MLLLLNAEFFWFSGFEDAPSDFSGEFCKIAETLVVFSSTGIGLESWTNEGDSEDTTGALVGFSVVPTSFSSTGIALELGSLTEMFPPRVAKTAAKQITNTKQTELFTSCMMDLVSFGGIVEDLSSVCNW